MPKPLLVGEANPYGADPEFALYPFPRGCAGHRLCEKVMGLTDREYLARFDRVNLCSTRWSMKEARVRACAIRKEQRSVPTVLLGAKVCAAFEFAFKPFALVGDMANVRERSIIERETERMPVYVVLPHPSGLSRAWNESGAYERARGVLRVAGILP